MNIVKIRNEMRNGRTIFDLPLRVTFYARVSTDRDEQLNSLENSTAFMSRPTAKNMRRLRGNMERMCRFCVTRHLPRTRQEPGMC